MMNRSDPILITGAARSGTSMVAGIINICGAFGGRLAGPNRYNQKGMFENREIVDQVTKPYLKELGCDPMGQYPLPDIHGLWIRPGICECIILIMKSHGWDGQSPWFYKGAKMCLLWPAFHAAFPNAKWIIIRRRDEDIINSCLKTGFMQAFQSAKDWQWWVDQHKKRFQEMYDAGLNIKEVWPELMMYEDYSQMREMIEWLRLQWKDQEIRNFVEPKLYREAVNG